MPKKIILIALIVLSVASFGVYKALAVPPGPGGTGYGALSIDASGNLLISSSSNVSVGGASVSGAARLSVQASTTNGSTNGLNVLNSQGTPVFQVSSNGALTVASTTNISSYGIMFSDNSIQTTAASGVPGGFPSSTPAGYVRPGIFGSIYGDTTPATFPGNLFVTGNMSVATTTAPSGGVLLVNGNIITLGSLSAKSSGHGLSVMDVSGNERIYSNLNADNGELYVANTSGATKVFLSSNASSYLTGGSVGIGTTTPSYLLDVNGNARVNGTLHFSSSGANKDYIQYNVTGLNFGQWGGSDNLLFIKDGGNIGIGTSTPAQKLSVVGTIESTTGGFKFPDGTTQTTASGSGNWTATSTGIFYSSGNVGIGTVSPSNIFQVSRDDSQTTWGSITAIAGFKNINQTNNTGVLFALQTNASDGSNRGFARIGGVVTNHTAGSVAGDLVFDTMSSDLSSEKMRITSAGYVGIGTSTPSRLLDIWGNGSSGIGLRIQSGGASNYTGIDIGRASYDGTLAVAGVAGNFSDISTAGDIIFRASTGNLILSARDASGNVYITTGAADTAKLSVMSGGLVTIPGTLSVGTTTAVASSGGGTPNVAFFNGQINVGANFGYAPDGNLRVASGMGVLSSNYSEGATGGNLQVNQNGTGATIIEYINGSTAYGPLGLNPSGGNVGIGTASPGSKLHVASGNVLDTPQGDIVMSRYWASTSDTRAGSIFEYYDSGTATDRVAIGVSGAGGTNGQPNAIAQAKMVVTAAGRVGIGTVSPGYTLEVNGPIFSGSRQNVSFGGAIAGGDSAAGGFIGGQIYNANWVGVGGRTNQGNGIGVYGEATSSLGIGGEFQNTGSATGLALYVPASGGYVGFGTSTPASMLSVVGTITQSAAKNCGLSSNASGGIICTSDERLKNVLGPYTGGLDAILGINPINFRYKGENYDHLGFSAQNVREFIPQATPVQDGGYLGLDTNAITATLVNAVKEQQKEIDGLKTEIKALKSAR